MGRETRADLLDRVRGLQHRLDEAEETLGALGSGEVDAVVTSGRGGDHVYTLKGADEAYRVMVQTMGEGALTITRDGLILFANEQFASMLGMPLGRVIGSSMWDFIATESAPAFGAVLAARAAIRAEARLKQEPATMVPVQLAASVLALDGAECVCLIVTNLTEIKNAQAKLNSSQRMLQLVLDTIPLGVFWKASDGRYLGGNRRFTTDAGFSAQGEFVGRSDLEMPWKEQAAIFREVDRRVVASGVAEVGYEERRRLAGGTSIRTINTKTPLVGDDGEVVGILGTYQDTTRLRVTEELLADVEKVGNIGGWEIDLATQKLEWTRGIYRILEVDSAYQPTLRKGIEFYTPASRRIIEPALERATKHGDSFDLELEIITARGNLRAVQVMGRVDQERRRLLGWFQDISERKGVEQSLRESEEKFRALAELVPQLVWMCMPDGLNVYFNHRWVEYTGLSLEESYGRGWNTPFHPDDKQPAWHAWNHAVETGSTYSIECRLQRADGRYRWFLIKGVPSRDATDQIVKWFGTCTDIDDLKQAQEEMRKMNHGLELLRDAVQKLASTHDLASIAPLLSFSARRLVNADGAVFATREDDMCHYVAEDSPRSLWEGQKVPIKASVGGWAMLNAANALVEDVHTDARIVVDACKPEVVKSLVVIPVRLSRPGGAILCYWERTHLPAQDEVRLLEALAEAAGVALDSAQLYAELEKRVTDRTTQLQAANQELESFAYSVSHDLRAPLRALDGFSEALLSQYHDLLEDRGKHYLQRIREGAQRMGRLIDDLLNLSRITRRAFDQQPVALSELAGDIVAELRDEYPQRQVECVIAPDLAVDGDPNLMRIALQNLFANAWKFTGKCQNARIEFGVREQEEERVYFVRDNGVGFDMAYAGKLFAPFQRLHGMQEFPGTGIGLATVQRIVIRHGGRIWAEAALDKGATFCFTLGKAL